MEDLTELEAPRHFEEYDVFLDEIRNSKPTMTDDPFVETKEQHRRRPWGSAEAPWL